MPAEPNNLPHFDPAALAARVAELEAVVSALSMRLLEVPKAKPPLMSVRDVGRRLNVSERTVRTLIADGQLRPIPIRGQHRFSPAAIDAYIVACSKRSAA